MTKRALLIYNPMARSAPAIETLQTALDGLAGWESSLVITQREDQAVELARDAAEQGLDAVIACGGDGTINEVANGLAGSETAMAVVPAGTGNVWAKEVRLPHDPVAALQQLNEGEVRTIDLGRAGDRYFVLMAGIGFDAAITRNISLVWKRRLGAAWYVIWGLRCGLTYRATSVPKLTVDEEALPGRFYWLLLGNTRSYGGVINLTNLATADDQKLDMCLVREGGLLRLAWIGAWALFGRHASRPEVVYRQVRSIQVGVRGLPVQLDGDYFGETPMNFEVAAAALRVIVPAGLKSPLFTT